MLFIKVIKFAFILQSCLCESFLEVSYDDNGDIVFPCKPQKSANLYVSLGEKNHLVTADEPMFILDDRKMAYNSSSGFTLLDSRISDFSIKAFCEYNDPVTTNENYTIEVLTKPTITDEGGAYVGDDVVINCSLIAPLGVSIDVSIYDPMNNKMETNHTQDDSEDSILPIHYSTLVKNIQKHQEGFYACQVWTSDHNNVETKVKTSKYIEVRDKIDSTINITEYNKMNQQEKSIGEYVEWKLNIASYSKATIKIMDLNNNEIVQDERMPKYEIIHISPTKILFIINNVQREDSGFYLVEAITKYNTSKISLELLVFSPPSVNIISKEYFAPNSNVNVSCEVTGYPLSTIIWQFQPCVEKNNCSKRNLTESSDVTTINDFTVKSVITMYANQSGQLICEANNSLGKSHEPSGFYLSDVDDGFSVTANSDIITEKDDITLSCKISKFKKIPSEPRWYKGNKLLNFTQNLSAKFVSSRYSRTYMLMIYNVNQSYNDNYKCEAGNETKGISILVHDAARPEINRTLLKNKTIDSYLGSEKYFDCFVKGYPPAIINWYKDGSMITKSERVKIQSNNVFHSSLKITRIVEEDGGTYKCRAVNRLGVDVLSFEIRIKNKEIKKVYLGIICSLIVIFFIMLVYLIIKIREDRKLKKQFSLKGYFNKEFKKGDMQCLNPELGLDEQAELLPYDNSFEFPREHLVLGPQLGSGAFGVVRKAMAYNIIDGEESSTVAVKMVKKTAEATFIKALVSELKIMVHLGKHLNVVNLLGACTNNVAKRELLVIVEYCRFGNIHNFLLRHRKSFINQIVQGTDDIDFSIGADLADRTYSVSSYRSGNRTPYSPKHFHFPYKGSVETPLLLKGNTSNGGQEVTSDGCVQPEWRSNYRGDYNYNKDVKPITTQDLICWSFQVAKGMEYLSSRKVLHGDLAARNILLADNNVVKICDFGLAKNMYKDDNYKKKGQAPLPIKWMSIESIKSGIFSTQSDVWSFGVVMWEFFTLSETPYSCLEINDEFSEKLANGYRLKKPEYSTNLLYEIMLDCWRMDPLLRPSFSELSTRLSNNLDINITNQIVDLSEPYMEMNTKWISERGDADYLAMMAAPDYKNYDISNKNEYVNIPLDPPVIEDNVTEELDNSYLPMVGQNTDGQRKLSTTSQIMSTYPEPLKYENLGENDFELKPLQLNRFDSGVGDSKPATPVSANPGRAMSASVSNRCYHDFFFK